MCKDGIFRNMDQDAQDKEEEMQEALKDLSALMMKAKEMVRSASRPPPICVEI